MKQNIFVNTGRKAYRVFSYILVLCDLFTPCNYRVLYVLEKKQNNFTIIMSVVRNWNVKAVSI